MQDYFREFLLRWWRSTDNKCIAYFVFGGTPPKEPTTTELWKRYSNR